MGQEPFEIKDIFAKAMSRFSSSGGSSGFKLSNFNYSSEELRDIVNEKKIEVLSVLVIFIAVSGAYTIFSKRSQEIAAIQEQIKLLEEKEVPAKDYQKVLGENKNYMNSLPPSIAENKFISELTAWAGRRGIKVTSFEPPQTKTEDFYVQTSIRMTCVADNFHIALLFLSDIERSQYALKVDSWNVNVDTSMVMQSMGFTQGGKGGSSRRTRAPRIVMDLTVVSTELIDKMEDDNKK